MTCFSKQEIQVTSRCVTFERQAVLQLHLLFTVQSLDPLTFRAELFFLVTAAAVT